MEINHQVQLITYPDSLGGNLATLRRCLQQYFPVHFPGGVHILPPFPSSGDRGFAPTNYFQIEPRFGTWDDLRQIGHQWPVLVDLMVNHISRQSHYFQDFAQRGRHSPYADLFLTLDKIWPDGEPDPADVAKIFLRRPVPPFADIEVTVSSERVRVWATFGSRAWSEQLDLDVNSPVTRRLFQDILAFFSRQGVQIVRLDAVAFVTKVPGTSCFFVEPQIWEFMDWMRRQAEAVKITLLPEVHSTYEVQAGLAEHGYWVYNFVLPLLVLHTLLNRSSATLKAHLQTCPRRQFTMLDCHDGLPVQPDLDGLLEVDCAQEIVKTCLARGGNVSPILTVAHRRRPDFDAHQINITYYSALGGDDDAYLAARAIQFFAPGVPQVYYVGLLAGENDLEAVAQTGEKRAINRHNYSPEEIEQALQRPVVQRLLELIRFRNQHPAFSGEFSVLDSSDEQLRLAWQQDAQRCELQVDLIQAQCEIEYSAPGGGLQRYRP